MNFAKSVDKSEKSGIIKTGSDNVALEYQRYGRNKNTLVNKSYIDSGEYKRKFDNITDNPDVNKTLYNCAKKALKHRSGTEFEDMYWIDGDAGEIIQSALNENDPMGVMYSEPIKKAIAGRDNLITLHTHPHSMPPSVDDFNSNHSHRYSKSVVACHDGKVFVYDSNSIIEQKLYDLYIAQFISDGYSEYDAQILTLKKLVQSYDINFMEV